MLPNVTNHTIYFSSTNYSIINMIKMYTFPFQWVSEETGFFNQFFKNEKPLDTLTIKWS